MNSLSQLLNQELCPEELQEYFFLPTRFYFKRLCLSFSSAHIPNKLLNIRTHLRSCNITTQRVFKQAGSLRKFKKKVTVFSKPPSGPPLSSNRNIDMEQPIKLKRTQSPNVVCATGIEKKISEPIQKITPRDSQSQRWIALFLAWMAHPCLRDSPLGNCGVSPWKPSRLLALAVLSMLMQT